MEVVLPQVTSVTKKFENGGGDVLQTASVSQPHHLGTPDPEFKGSLPPRWLVVALFA